MCKYRSIRKIWTINMDTKYILVGQVYSQSWKQPQVHLLTSRCSHGFCHIQLTRKNAIRETPIEIKKKAGESKLNICEPKLHPGANPSAGPKWYELKVVAFEISGATQESVWKECFWVVPTFGVSSDSPSIDENGGTFWHVIAEYCALLLALPWQQ